MSITLSTTQQQIIRHIFIFAAVMSSSEQPSHEASEANMLWNETQGDFLGVDEHGAEGYVYKDEEELHGVRQDGENGQEGFSPEEGANPYIVRDFKRAKPRKKKIQAIAPQLSIINQIQQTATQLNIEKVLPKQQQGSEISKSTEPKRTPKKIILLMQFLSIGFLSLILSYLSYRLIPENYLLTDMTQGQRKILLTRQYEPNKVYYYDKMMTTYSNQTMAQINYTMLLVVDSKEYGDVVFNCMLQKRMQTLYNQTDGSVIQEVQWDNSTIFYDLLRHGAGAASAASQLTIDPNDTQYNSSTTPALSAFRFVVGDDGSIRHFTFPKLIDKTVLSLFRSFVKIFSPLLKKEMYQSGQPVTSQRDLQRVNHLTRLLQAVGNDTNSTDQQEQQNYTWYIETAKHSYETDDQKIVLRKQATVNSSSVSHNTFSEFWQTNVFTTQGQLISADLTSSTRFLTREQPQKQDVSNFNITTDYENLQRCDMRMLDSFVSQEQDKGAFGGFLKFYEDDNQTYTYTLNQLYDFIDGTLEGEGEQEIGPPGSRRLLLKKNQAVLLLYEKNVDLVETNMIGMRIAAYGYARLIIRLSQDEINPLEQKPALVAEAGTVIVTAFHRSRYPIFQFAVEFPAMSLDFTLEHIQIVMDLMRDLFLMKTHELIDSILDNSYESDLLPKIDKIKQIVHKLNEVINAVEKIHNPELTVKKILAAVKEIKRIMHLKGKGLLEPQLQFVKNLYDELMAFYRDTFGEALAKFNQAKDQLVQIRDQGSSFMSGHLESYVKVEVHEIKQKIETLIPLDVFEQYQRQMQKAQPIIDYLRFVRNEGADYSDQINATINLHEENMIKMVKHVVDLYFRNQTNITDTFVGIVNRRFDTVVQELRQFDVMMNNVDVPEMNRRSLEFFASFIYTDLQSQTWLNQYRSRMATLEAQSRGADAQKGGCCQWKKKKRFFGGGGRTCERWNPAQGDQAAQRYWYDGFKAGTQPFFQFISNELAKYLIESRGLIDSGLTDIVTKYQQIQSRIPYYQTLIPHDQFDDLKAKAMQRRAGAISTRSRVGCGGTGNLDAYIAGLAELANFIQRMKQRYIESINRCKYILAEFNTTVYTAIKDNDIIINSVPTYFNLYKGYQDFSLELYRQIKEITLTYDPQQFADSIRIARDVFTLYERITASLDQLCKHRPLNKSTIEDVIRKEYERMYDYLRPMSNNFLSGELVRIKSFLNYGAFDLYQRYLAITFCEDRAQWQVDIATLYPDWKNFTLIFDLYDRMLQVKNYTNISLNSLNTQAASLERRFYRLFTPLGYQQHVYRAEWIAQTYKKTNRNVSQQLSNLREEAKTIYMYMMARRPQITDGLLIFIDTPYTLNSDQMFVGIVDRVKLSLDIIEQLSFDVIAFVVSAKDVQEYYQYKMGNFTQGGYFIHDTFVSLCNKFLNLNTSVTQKYLNEIHRDLRTLHTIFNSTIFPNVTEDKQQIVFTYKDYRYTSTYLQQLFINAMKRLVQFHNMTKDKQSVMYHRMKQLIDLALTLIEDLEIASLNSVHELAQTLLEKFMQFYNDYPIIMNELDDFEKLALADFRKAFTFFEFFKIVQKKAETKHNHSYSAILDKIKETQDNLVQNVKFYEKFKLRSVYKQIERVKPELAIEFSSLWQQATKELEKITRYFSEISADIIGILTDLNEAKDKLKIITGRIDSRVANIEREYQQIRKRLFNIRELTFVNCIDDLSNIVAKALQRISEQTGRIMNEDFAAIDELAVKTIRGETTEIRDLIRQAKSEYEIMKRNVDRFTRRIELGLHKIGQFVKNDEIVKYQKLKNGYLHIKSRTNHKKSPKQIVLFRKDITPTSWTSWKPSPIQSPLGPFGVDIQIEFKLQAFVQIGLENYRSVTIGVSFQAGVHITADIYYKYMQIFKIGLYIKGTVVRAQILPQFVLKNVIPIQLVQAILGIEEIVKHNDAAVEFVTDLALYAAQVEVGLLFGIRWFKIIWKQFSFCFSFWIFKFCFRIRLPIGIEFTWKQWRVGYKFKGIQLYRKRLFTLTLATWRY